MSLQALATDFKWCPHCKCCRACWEVDEQAECCFVQDDGFIVCNCYLDREGQFEDDYDPA